MCIFEDTCLTPQNAIRSGGCFNKTLLIRPVRVLQHVRSAIDLTEEANVSEISNAYRLKRLYMRNR